VNVVALSQLLLLYGWFALAALLLILLLIGRSYERFAAERTHYYLLLLPIFGFGLSAVRYASIDRIVGDAPADLLSGMSGLLLIVLSVRLYQQMTRGRR
jgi:type II secretory pathway component PulF